jgi:prepilin-type N-terminal cleavage/methylation domain-containing protein
MKRRKGFTLMELIIVVIIIGILAMIGLPQFFKTVERARFGEAFEILGAARSAQLRYALQNSAGTTTNDFNNLDIDAFTPKYWGQPTLTSQNCQTGSGTVARTTRGVFTVTIDCNGTLSCSPVASCPPMPN